VTLVDRGDAGLAAARVKAQIADEVARAGNRSMRPIVAIARSRGRDVDAGIVISRRISAPPTA
jgi:hypothetical protein